MLDIFIGWYHLDYDLVWLISLLFISYSKNHFPVSAGGFAKVSSKLYEPSEMVYDNSAIDCLEVQELGSIHSKDQCFVKEIWGFITYLKLKLVVKFVFGKVFWKSSTSMVLIWKKMYLEWDLKFFMSLEVQEVLRVCSKSYLFLFVLY